jgi:ABC-type amino acid transport substrate-binding protein
MRNAKIWLAALVAIFALVVASCASNEGEETGATGGAAGTAATGATGETGFPSFTTLEEGVLQVGNCLDFKPFEWVQGGDEKGFDIDLVEEVAARLDLQVEWVRADFDTVFTAVAGDQFDMVAAAATILPEREEIVDFSEPYYNSRQSLTVNAQETPDITSTDQLGEGDVVGVQKGTTGKTWAEENLVPNGVELKTFQVVSDIFRDLEAGNIQGIINDEPASEAIVKDLPALSVVQAIDTDEKYGFAFSPSNPELREAFNQAFAQVVADGTYADILLKYFPGVEVPEEFQPTA